MKFDLSLFRELNDEYKDKPLVKTPPSKAPADVNARGVSRAKAVTAMKGFSGRGLEIGCGRGEVCRALASNHGCEMVGVDVKEYPGWAEPADKVQLTKADLSLGQHDDLGTFDFIYSMAVFEHVRHPHAMLQKAFDLLKPGGRMWLTANLYRGPKASHRYREVYFPWPHLLFSDEVFREFYQSIGLPPARPAWINELSIADYYNYFNLIGFKREKTKFRTTPIDEGFYARFRDKLERIPRYDLERDFIEVVLKKPGIPRRDEQPQPPRSQVTPRWRQVLRRLKAG